MSGDTASFRAFGIHTQECPPTRDQRGGNSAQSMQLNVPPLGKSIKEITRKYFQLLDSSCYWVLWSILSKHQNINYKLEQRKAVCKRTL